MCIEARVAAVTGRTDQGEGMKSPVRRLASAVRFERPGAASNRLVYRRIEDFLEMLERTPFDGLRLYAVRSLSPASLNEARHRAQTASDQAGRMDLRLDLAGAIADFLRRSIDNYAYDPTMIGTAWILRPEDRERLRKTLVDASMAVVAQDLIDEATFDELVGPCARLVQ
jgi:hypothetical protein